MSETNVLYIHVPVTSSGQRMYSSIHVALPLGWQPPIVLNISVEDPLQTLHIPSSLLPGHDNRRAEKQKSQSQQSVRVLFYLFYLKGSGWGWRDKIAKSVAPPVTSRQGMTSRKLEREQCQSVRGVVRGWGAKSATTPVTSSQGSTSGKLKNRKADMLIGAVHFFKYTRGGRQTLSTPNYQSLELDIRSERIC